MLTSATHTTRARFATLFGFAAVVMGMSTARAQAPGATPSGVAPRPNPRGMATAGAGEKQSKHRSVCAIGRRGAPCSSIFLLELGVRSRNGRGVGTFDVGLLVNQGDDQAWGATIGAIGIDQQDGWQAKLRYRRWLDDYLGIDLALGVGKVGQYAPNKQTVGTAEVALELGDIIAVTAGLDTYSAGDRRPAAMAGFRIGTYPTLVVLKFLSELAGR